MPSRRLTLVILLAATATGLAACSSTASSPETTTLTFTTSFTDRQVMDTGEQGSSLGDYINGHGDVLDTAGQVIGQFDVSSQTTGRTDTSEIRLVTAEYEFGDGADSFIIQGSERFALDGGQPDLDRPLNYAVVGGTGTYMGANGECLVHRRDAAYEVDCTFLTSKA